MTCKRGSWAAQDDSSCRALRPHLLVVLRSLQGAFTGCPEEPPSHVYRSCRGFPKPRLQVVLRALQAAFTFIILVALQLSFQPMAISSRCCLSIFMHIPRLFLCSASVGPVTLRRSRQSEKVKHWPSHFIAERGWGNLAADSFAEPGALHIQVQASVANHVKRFFYLTRLLLLRFIAIIMAMSYRARATVVSNKKNEVIVVDSIQVPRASSSHATQLRDIHLHCVGCAAKNPLKQTKDWLATSFPKPDTSPNMSSNSVQIACRSVLPACMSLMLLKFTAGSFIAARVAAEAPPNWWD